MSGLSSSPVWGRSPSAMGGPDFGGHGGPGSVGSMSQASPLQALQSMDSQTSSALDILSPSPRGSHDPPFPPPTPPFDASPGGVGGGTGGADLRQRPGKLCQLLTQNTSLEQLGPRSLLMSGAVQRSGSNRSAMASPGLGKSGLKSPEEQLHRSPTPGPGQSPPEKPQSTSNEDGEVILSGQATEAEKKDNFILKKLLSQEEDSDPPTIMDHEISSSPQTTGPGTNDCDRNMDKNEAEPKKTTNVLLKVTCLLNSLSCYNNYPWHAQALILIKSLWNTHETLIIFDGKWCNHFNILKFI